MPWESARGQSVHLDGISRGTASATLNWNGGAGPYLVEVSSNLQEWTEQGDPGWETNRTLAAHGATAYYRVQDLGAVNRLGAFHGLLQTGQGEFGMLMGRHRLKSRWWLYKPVGALSNVPANFFRKLIVHHQFLEDGKVSTFAGPLESLGAVATPGNAQQLTVSWTRGSGLAQRQFVLTMDFPYKVNAVRSAEPIASDPIYDLKCSYSTDQVELDMYQMTASPTRTDTISLIQLAPPEANDWWKHTYSASDRSIVVGLSYREGNFLYQGDPLFVLKTFVLHEWIEPTSIAGGRLPSFTTESYYSRTLFPGHHNFWEQVLIEPAADPSVSEAVRASLASANIRYIYVYKDLALGMSPDDIAFIGFDNSIREP
jgi:hypothetical protein